MGFSKGVKSVSSCVIACSKKLKSKTPGFLKGVARISRRCVRACSRKSKSKTAEADPVSCSSESKSKTPDPELSWTHITLEIVNDNKGSYVTKVNKLIKELRSTKDGFRSCDFDVKDKKMHITGCIDPEKVMKHIKKFIDSGQLKVDNYQFGNCSSNLFRKKEVPSTKITNPSTNNANPSTNNTNTTVGYYHPQGYGSYYGNGGYNNVGWYGNGGYDGYFAHNGGYSGNSYNYQPEPAVYQRRIGYDHIDCAGDASECSGHHNAKAETPDKTQDKRN